jgi:hypothetical protein
LRIVLGSRSSDSFERATVLWKRPSSDRCNSSPLHVDRRDWRRSFRMIYGEDCPHNPRSDPGNTRRRKAGTGHLTTCRRSRTIDRSSLRSLRSLWVVIPTPFGLPHPENPTSEAKWIENMVIIQNEKPVAIAANSGRDSPLDKRGKPPCRAQGRPSAGLAAPSRWAPGKTRPHAGRSFQARPAEACAACSRRPDGANTNQPRATPWGRGKIRRPNPTAMGICHDSK